MKRLPSLSPDVVIVGEQPTQRKSRAQTPSGKGYGHTDSEQRYVPTPYDPQALILSAAKVALTMIEWHAGRWKHGSNWRVTEAIEALRILKEWLERRGQWNNG